MDRKNRASVIFRLGLAILTLSQILCINESAIAAELCPFVSQNAEIQGLVSTTSTTLRQLELDKNNCGEELIQAIRAVKDLPTAIEEAYDPLTGLRHRRQFLLSEYVKAEARGDGGLNAEVWQADLDAVDEQIRLAEIETASRDHADRAERDVLLMTSNLVSALSEQVRDSTSPCARNLTKNFSSQILSIGLGALSAVAPGLGLSANSKASVSLVAGVLSKIANFRSKMPSKELAGFDKGVQTIDLACLYQNIVSTSCQFEEVYRNQGSPTDGPLEKYIQKLKSETKNWNKFDKIIGSKQMQENRNILNSLSNMLAGSTLTLTGGSAFENDFSAFQSDSPGEVEQLRRSIQQYQTLKRYFIGGEFDSLSSLSQKSTATNRLENFVYHWMRELSGYGFDTETTSDDGSELGYREKFAKNHEKILELIEIKLKELGGGGSGVSTTGVQAFNLQSWAPVVDQLEIVKRGNGAIRDLAREKLAEGDLPRSQRTEWSRLKPLLERSDRFIDDFLSWAELDPDSMSPEKYMEEVQAIGGKLRSQLGAQANLSAVSIENKAEVAIFSPLQKFISNSTLQSFEPIGLGGVLGYDHGAREMSAWQGYHTAFQALSPRVRANLTVADHAVLTQARDLFEGRTSKLQQGLVDGIKDKINGIPGSSNPAALRSEVRELCALSQSLPRKASRHAIPECEPFLSRSILKEFDRNEVPNCSYHRYSVAKKREKYIKKKPSDGLGLPELHLYHNGEKVGPNWEGPKGKK